MEALSVDLQRRRLDREIAPVHEHALLEALGSLVVYNEESGFINLSHFSVKVSRKHMVYLYFKLGLMAHLGVPHWSVKPKESVQVSYRYADSPCTGGTPLHVLYCSRDQASGTFQERDHLRSPV